MTRLDFKLLAKDAIRGTLSFRYHAGHKAKVQYILRTLEPKFGRLSQADIKRADAYARDVLGHYHFAPWLYVYTTIAGQFKEGWIPDNYYGHVVVPLLNGRYGRTSYLKPLARKIFGSDTFPDIASYVNGLFLTPDHAVIPHSDVKDFIFRNSEKVAFKVDDSQQGRGVFFLSPPDFGIPQIQSLGNGVFQTYVVQHPMFDEFARNSVATFRITTAVDDDGHVSVRACYLRLGRGEDTHVQSRSHVRVAIDPATGDFSREGYLANWLPVEEHPDTGTKFAGHRIPAFCRCVSTVLELHRKVPFVRCVGWDIAVDADEGVRIMEWNGAHNDIKFSEATQGPCFADLGWERLAH